MAIALILFCVFQVMTALAHAAPTWSNLSGLSAVTVANTSLMPPLSTMADEEAKHDKRSVIHFPFQKRYIGISTRTMVVYTNGTVAGVSKLDPKFGIFQLIAACFVGNITPRLDKEKDKQYGKISILGVMSELYICMNKDGVAFGSRNCTDECQFKQEIASENSGAHVYYSLKYNGTKPLKHLLKQQSTQKTDTKWYLAINKKSGNMIKGWKARRDRETAQFLERPVDDPGYKETRYQPVTTTRQPGQAGTIENIDKNGNIQVIQQDNPNPSNKKRKHKKSRKKNRRNRQKEKKNRRRRKKKKGRRNENCGGDDPLNLFRIGSPCQSSNNGQETGTLENRPSSMPFSTNPNRKRHQPSRGFGGGDRLSTNPTRRQFNLFSFPMR